MPPSMRNRSPLSGAGSGTYTGTYTVIAAHNDITNPEATAITLTDDAGNVSSTGASSGSAFTIDANRPTITSIETVDLNADGDLDALHITFTENVDDTFIEDDDFAVTGGVTVAAFSSTTNSDTADDNDIYITFTEGVLNSGATPDLTYTQDAATDLTDLAGNTMDNVAATTSTDTAAPILLSAASSLPLFGVNVQNTTVFTLTFSEAMNVDEGASTDIDDFNLVTATTAGSTLTFGASTNTVTITFSGVTTSDDWA